MKKKGQITLFVILGIIILVIIISSIFLFRKVSKKEDISTISRIDDLSKSIDNYVKSCIKESAEEGIYKIGLNGGYLNPNGDKKYGELGDGEISKIHYHTENGILPYIIDDTKIKLRSKEKIEEILANYVVEETQKCINLSSYEKKGLEIFSPKINFEKINFDFSKAIVPYSNTKINSKTIIGNERIIFDLTYPIIFKSSEEDYEAILEDFSVTIPIRFNEIYERVKLFSERLKDKQNYNLREECNKYSFEDNLLNIYVKSNPYTYEYWVRFIDAKPVFENKVPYTFQFAVKNIALEGECIG